MAVRPRYLALGLLMFAGCGEDTGPVPGIRVSDSLGIPVVFNPPPESDTVAPRSLSAAPVVSIGSAVGAAASDLFDVAGGALLGDGRVVLANAGTHELRFYDPEGKHLRSVGGQGSGPGEFRLLNWAGTFRGDSIMTVDPLLRRAAVFDSSGSFVRSSFLPDVGGRMPQPMGVLMDGRILFTPLVASPDPPAALWTTTGIERRARQPILIRPGSEAVDTIGVQMPGREWFRNVEQRAMLMVPLGRNLHGSAAGDRIALGDDDSFRIHIYDDTGGMMAVVAQDQVQRKVREEEYWAVAEAEILSQLEMPNFRARMRELLEEMPRPTTWPDYSAVRLDRQGNLWVRATSDSGGNGDIWSKFDSEGRLAIRIEVPEGLEILDIRDDAILGLIEDDLGVQRAEIYRITDHPPI